MTNFMSNSTADEARERAAFVLAISPDATHAEALASYKKHVAIMHPRAGGDRIAYQTLLAAWAVWNQLTEDAQAGAPSLSDAATLRSARLRNEEQSLVALDAAGYGIDVTAIDFEPEPETEVDVIVDTRNEYYEIDLVAIEALPLEYRAYAVAGSAAVMRTAAGTVHHLA